MKTTLIFIFLLIIIPIVSGGENIAINKVPSVSGGYWYFYLPTNIQYITDGDFSTASSGLWGADPWIYAFSTANIEGNTYITIDLGQAYNISSIRYKIKARQEGMSTSYISISVSENNINWKQTALMATGGQYVVIEKDATTRPELPNVRYVRSSVWSCCGSNNIGISWYEIQAYNNSNIPSIPQITSPSNNSKHWNNAITFTWNASTDADNDPLSYNLIVATDNNFGNIIYQTNTTNLSSSSITTTDGQKYYARVRAYDGYEFSPWSNSTETLTGTSLTNGSWLNFTSPVTASSVTINFTGLSATGGAWWNTSYDTAIFNQIPNGARPVVMSVNITNATGVSNKTHMYLNGSCHQVNCTDLRNVINNATEQSYWREDNITNSGFSQVWVNLTANGTDAWYTGATGVPDVSNNITTFPQWHGAASTDFHDANIINPTNGFIYEAKVMRTSAIGTDWLVWGGFDGVTESGDSLILQSYSSANLRAFTSFDNGVPTDKSANPDFTPGQSYRLKIIMTGSLAQGYVDNVQIGTDTTTTLPNTPVGLSFRIRSGTGLQNFSFMRPYYSSPSEWNTWSAPQSPPQAASIVWAEPQGHPVSENKTTTGNFALINLTLNSSTQVQNIRLVSNSTTFNATISAARGITTFTELPLSSPAVSQTQIYQSSQASQITVTGSDADGNLTGVQVGIIFNGTETNYSMINSSGIWSYSFMRGVSGTYTINNFYANDTSTGETVFPATLTITVVPVAAGGVPGQGGQGGSPIDQIRDLLGVSGKIPTGSTINLKTTAKENPIAASLLFVIGAIMMVAPFASKKITTGTFFWGMLAVTISLYSQGIIK